MRNGEHESRPSEHPGQVHYNSLTQRDPASGPLYKYRAEDSLGVDEMLRDGFVYFAPADTLNDPFDCKPSFKKLSRLTLNQIIERNGRRLARQAGLLTNEIDGWIERAKRGTSRNHFEEIMLAGRSAMGIYSLSETVTCALLWAHYADSHRGFCVELSPTDEEDDLLRYASHVKYSSCRPVLSAFDVEFSTSAAMSDSTVEKLVLTKGVDWSYEEECRVVASVPGGFKALKPAAITGIYLGVDASAGLEDRLRNLVRVRNPAPSFFRMRLHDERYAIEFDPI